MIYFTALFLPSPRWEGQRSRATGRFAGRALRNLPAMVQRAIPLLQANCRLLGQQYQVVLDGNLRSDPHGQQACDLVRSGLSGLPGASLSEYVFPRQGAWANKWHAVRYALRQFGKPLLWVDFLDARVAELLSPEEIRFLEETAERKGIVVEWHSFRCFGPPPRNSDGSVAGGRAKQPQTSIYYLCTEEVPNLCLATGIDHDQISLMHALQERDGLFQDRLTEEAMLAFSSRGLFKTTGDSQAHKIHTNRKDCFRPKIFHKC